MRWQRKGLIYVPTGDLWWAQRGAHFPTATIIGDEIVRIYYGSKDAQGFGRTGYVDVAATDPRRILHIAPEPVLGLGELGTFDDCGALPNSVFEYQGQRYLFYQGFQRTHRVPYLAFMGIAVANDQGSRWRKVGRTPVMERTEEEPFIRCTPCVIRDGEVLKMWYVSGVNWTQDTNGLHYICVIRYATSVDARNWQTHPHVCLEPDLEDEYAVGRPAVVRDRDLYRMWYSIRSFPDSYTIGYAESLDGIAWERKDAQAGIEKSQSGWDSEMICYPSVVDIRGERLMFYNGNSRGVSGFGYAVLEE
jgi:predicted GH43/DUF377 family glycosyl hydrolase